MSEIYFLGREDREGLALVQKRKPLSFDDEVGGWDNLRANDELYEMPTGKHKQLLADPEPALHVFDSRTVQKDEDKDPEAPWPTITYQTRFGVDQ